LTDFSQKAATRQWSITMQGSYLGNSKPWLYHRLATVIYLCKIPLNNFSSCFDILTPQSSKDVNYICREWRNYDGP